MLKTYITSILLVISLVFVAVTSARFIQDTDERLVKRTMSDQRLAELQALIALSKGHGIPIGHGQIDPWRIGKRKKRDLSSYLEDADTEETNRRLNLLNLLLQNDEDLFS